MKLSGRYALDAAGVLHPWPAPRGVQAVAAVRVSAKPCATGLSWADRAGRAMAEVMEAEIAESPGIEQVMSKPKNNWKRLAKAYAAKSGPVRVRPAPVLQPAMSREECPRCGIPGWRGCAHQTAFAEDYAGHPAQRAQSGARHKTD